jgi:hypothetical protein
MTAILPLPVGWSYRSSYPDKNLHANDEVVSRMVNELVSDASALIHEIYGNWRKVDHVSGVLCIKE